MLGWVAVGLGFWQKCNMLDYFSSANNINLSKSVPVFSYSVSSFIICSIRDLHHSFLGPASHYLGTCIWTSRTCITAYWDLHHIFRGLASHYQGTCITLSMDLDHIFRGPASHFPGTCITLSRDLPFIIQGPAIHYPDLLHHPVLILPLLPSIDITRFTQNWYH